MKLQKSVIVASGDGRIKGSCVLCVDESSVNNREQSGEIYFFVESGDDQDETRCEIRKRKWMRRKKWFVVLFHQKK